MESAVRPEGSGGVLLVELHRWLRWGKRALWAVSALFVVVVLAEAARVFQTACDVHPLLGWVALLGMVAALALVAWPVWRFLSVPRVVQPPAIPPPDRLTLADLRAEARYLDRYLRGLERNDELTARRAEVARARKDLATWAREKLRDGSASDLAALDAELSEWVRAQVLPLVAELDARAERWIYQEALAVGLGTAVSPNGTLDAFVMLWRSLQLTSRLAVLYYGRPGLWGTLAICRDVSLATAAAAYLQNITDSLGGLLARTVGGVTGVVAGPLVEGVTNGVVVLRIGFLARERCRAFRSWDTGARRSAMARALEATQKKSVELSSEILRRAGAGLGSFASAAGAGVSQVASRTADSVSFAAGTAKTFAVDLGRRLGLLRPGEGPVGESDGEARERGGSP